MVDSYSSDNGVYDATSNRNDNGSVASNAIVDGAISPGNGDIFGYVATGGGLPSFGPNGSLRGKDTPSGVKIDQSRIAYDFYSEFEDIEQPAGNASVDPPIPASGTIGVSTHTTPTDYYVTDFENKNTDKLIIDGPVRLIVDGNWSSKGEIEVTANGSVELYIAGNMDIGGNGMVNKTNIPSKFVVFGTNKVDKAKTIKLHGNGAIHASIYAPNAVLEMKGGGNSGEFMGAAVASSIKMTGNSNFHYDEALGSFAVDNSYRVERWRELREFSERVPMDKPSELVAFAVRYDTN